MKNKKAGCVRAGLGVFCLFLGVLRADAALELAPAFTDHMVIARDRPAAIWGWSDPGREVQVTFVPETGDPVEVRATAATDGRWDVQLPAQKGGVKGSLEVATSGGDSQKISNVAFGEVWFCAGQSNMYLQVFQTEGGAEAIAAAADPDLRLLSVRGSSAVPQRQVKAQWAPCDARSVKGFSAVAYYFGKKLREELGVPVGLIRSAYNGTFIESWMPMELLERLPETKEQAAEYRAMIETVGVSPDAAAIDALPKDQQAWAPGGRHAPAGLFNAMVHPFLSYPISGFLWYQGENNVRRPQKYAVTFPAMITEWRARWRRGDLPFLYVELAGYQAKSKAPVEENDWSDLREAQRAALALPNTAVATAIDVGSETDIHPRDKKTVGERLALAALEMVYGRKGTMRSPQLLSGEFQGAEVILHIDHAGDGLKTKDGAAPQALALRGSDGVWHAADARLAGSTIIVSSSHVQEPREVRHAWAMNPANLNVVNSAGLPLLPFRVSAPSRP